MGGIVLGVSVGGRGTHRENTMNYINDLITNRESDRFGVLSSLLQKNN